MKKTQSATALAAIGLVLCVLYPVPTLIVSALLVALYICTRQHRTVHHRPVKAVYISDEEYRAAMNAKRVNHAHAAHRRYADKTYVGPQERADDVPPF